MCASRKLSFRWMLPFCYQGNAILNNPRENLYLHIFSLCSWVPPFHDPLRLPPNIATLGKGLYVRKCTQVSYGTRFWQMKESAAARKKKEKSNRPKKKIGGEDGMIRKLWRKNGVAEVIFYMCSGIAWLEPLSACWKNTPHPPSSNFVLDVSYTKKCAANTQSAGYLYYMAPA